MDDWRTEYLGKPKGPRRSKLPVLGYVAFGAALLIAVTIAVTVAFLLTEAA
jgi:hypothetical protein